MVVVTPPMNGVTMRNRTRLLVLLAVALLGCADTPATTTSQQALDDERCTWGLGYWKNHPGAWSVTTLTLGSTAYTQDQLLAILHQPVEGNGLVSLAHQLIAAKLNRLAGAADVTGGALAYADVLVGDRVIPPIGTDALATEDTSETSAVLDELNKGRLDGACHTAFCGDGILDPLEQCDDGNLSNSDACVVGCVVAVCGDGYVNLAGGEQCDDQNADGQDGCFADCTLDNDPGND